MIRVGALAWQGSLADYLVEADACSNGDIEAGDFSRHGDFYEEVAIFFRQPAQSVAFRTHSNSDGAVKIHIIQGAVSFIRGADDPDAVFLKEFHCAGKVGDLNEGDAFRRSNGDTEDGFRQADGFVLGRDDGCYSRAIGGAEYGSQVVGVLYAVKDEEEGGLGCVSHHVLQFVF